MRYVLTSYRINFARTHTPATLWPVGHISRYIMRENTTEEAPTLARVSWGVGVGGHHKRGTREHARIHGSNFARTHIPASLWPVGHISRYIMRENTTGEAPTHVLVSWVVGVGGHRRGVLRDRELFWLPRCPHVCTTASTPTGALTQMHCTRELHRTYVHSCVVAVAMSRGRKIQVWGFPTSPRQSGATDRAVLLGPVPKHQSCWNRCPQQYSSVGRRVGEVCDWSKEPKIAEFGYGWLGGKNQLISSSQHIESKLEAKAKDQAMRQCADIEIWITTRGGSFSWVWWWAR